MYANVPSVTTYPVYLGDLDKVLAPFVTDEITDEQLDAKLRRFWIGIDRTLPDAFVHLDLGPHDSRLVRSILRVERSLRQAVPNITLKVDPHITPDDLIEDAVRTVFETGKPHFVNHPMMVRDHGERYASVSCYNSLKIGGGSHTLVRLNLKEVALLHSGTADEFLATTLPRYVELTAELAEARIRSLVEDQHFFDTHWLATEGLIDIDRFSAMFGIFGLAECVNLLIAYEGRDRDGEVRYGHDADGGCQRRLRFGHPHRPVAGGSRSGDADQADRLPGPWRPTPRSTVGRAQPRSAAGRRGPAASGGRVRHLRRVVRQSSASSDNGRIEMMRVRPTPLRS